MLQRWIGVFQANGQSSQHDVAVSGEIKFSEPNDSVAYIHLGIEKKHQPKIDSLQEPRMGEIPFICANPCINRFFYKSFISKL